MFPAPCAARFGPQVVKMSPDRCLADGYWLGFCYPYGPGEGADSPIHKSYARRPGLIEFNRG
jgi:hypothetical protein